MELGFNLVQCDFQFHALSIQCILIFVTSSVTAICEYAISLVIGKVPNITFSRSIQILELANKDFEITVFTMSNKLNDNVENCKRH